MTGRDRAIAVTYVFLALVEAAALFVLKNPWLAGVGLTFFVGFTVVMFVDWQKVKVGTSGIEAERRETTVALQEQVAPAIDAVVHGTAAIEEVAAQEGSVASQLGLPEQIEWPSLSAAIGQFLDEWEDDRRAGIEQIMTASAEWGWTMAGLGFTSPPRPIIEWSEEGEPTISYGTSASDSQREPLTGTWLRKRRAELMAGLADTDKRES